MSDILTERELDIIAAYIDGGTVAEAARRLSLHPQTVKNTLAVARRKAECDTTLQLVYRLASGDLDER